MNISGLKVSLLAVIISMVSLAACNLSPNSEIVIQTAIVQTMAAVPSSTLTSTPKNTSTPKPSLTPSLTPTQTLIPLGSIDLENLLLKPNDLPPGFTASQIQNLRQSDLDKFKPVNSIVQLLAHDNDSPYIELMLFDDKGAADSAYTELKGELVAFRGQDSVGEKAVSWSVSMSSIKRVWSHFCPMQCGRLYKLFRLK